MSHPAFPPAGSGRLPVVMRFQNREMTVMRGTETNRFGDETDVGIAIATGVPAALAEVGNETFNLSQSTRRTIRTFACRMPAYVDVDDDDTLMDEFTGYFFEIESIEEQAGIGMYPAMKLLTLTMRSGVSVGSDG